MVRHEIPHRRGGRPRTAKAQTWDKVIWQDGTWIDATPQPGGTYTKDTYPPRGRGRGESLTSPRRVAAKLRASEVVRLRAQGCTFAQIAQMTGFKDGSGAYRAMRRAMDRVDWDNQRRYELFKEKYGLTDEDVGRLLDEDL